MKKLFFKIVFAMLSFHLCNGQINQVRNPGFEELNRCPVWIDNISDAKYWSSIDTTWVITDTQISRFCVPELINNCTTIRMLTYPSNAYFYQIPHSGNSMIQVEMYYPFDTDATAPVKRDYAQGRLRNALIAGKQYCVHFYVSLEEVSGRAINKIGAYLDDASLDTTTSCGSPQISHIPQVYTTTIITDTLGWTKIEGTFIANGTERFITLGNFFDAAHTDTTRVYFPMAVSAGQSYYSWYLIDDVSVIATDAVAYAGRDTAISSRLTDSAWVGNHDGYLPTKWYVNGVLADSNTSGFMVHPAVTTQYVMELTVCGNVTRDTMKVTVWPLGLGNAQMRQLSNVQMAPNPVVNEIMIGGAAGTDVSVMDLAGRVIMGFHVATDKESVDVSGLLPGVYVVAVVDRVSGERVVRRVVKE